MNVLEKILEEIKEVEKKFVVGHEVLFALGATGLESEIEEIIRSHMNHSGDDTEMGDWIPVEERLPNKREFQEAYCRNHYAAEFLVTIEGATRPTTLYFKNNSWFDEDRNYYKVIAWQPLPEAYHPKETPAAEHIMSRFTRVE